MITISNRSKLLNSVYIIYSRRFYWSQGCWTFELKSLEASSYMLFESESKDIVQDLLELIAFGKIIEGNM